MKILIKPRIFKGVDSWSTKMNGVILVEKQHDIDKWWNLLCEQDSYWKEYKHLIKIAPKEIESESDIRRMCEYCGKTDIYDPESLQKSVKFIMHQEYVSD